MSVCLLRFLLIGIEEDDNLPLIETAEYAVNIALIFNTYLYSPSVPSICFKNFFGMTGARRTIRKAYWILSLTSTDSVE